MAASQLLSVVVLSVPDAVTFGSELGVPYSYPVINWGLYLLIHLHMPNWTDNEVRIDASIDAVKERLGSDDSHREFYFNMHKLFPESFASDDPTGTKDWDYDWTVHHTGSKWFPTIQYVLEHEGSTILSYSTARAPNNGTLERLHELTGWTIENEYEEPGGGFEGTFTCDGDGIRDEERPYRQRCQICDVKREREAFPLNNEDDICNDCRDNRPIQ